MELSPDQLTRLHTARAKINWDQVLKTASSLKGLSCKVDNLNDEFYGGCNLIYRLTFPSGPHLALRVPHDSSPTPFELTANTMRYIKETVPTIPVASVHAFSDSEDGDGVGLPYMLLDWLEGDTLHNWSRTFPPEPARRKVLAQLARIIVDLIKYTPQVPVTVPLTETQTQTEPQSTSTSTWMRRRIDGKLTRILSGGLPSPTFDPVDCLIYSAMADEKYLIPTLNAAPFPLMHTDLNRFNILVDDEFNITGILDWDDWARRLPFQFSAIYPSLIDLESTTEPTSADPSSQEDRHFFLAQFTSLLASSDSSGLSEETTKHLPLILADEELQVFHASFGSKNVYAEWVAKYCVRDAYWTKAAIAELDRFVLARKDWAESPEVRSLRLRLFGMQSGDSEEQR